VAAQTVSVSALFVRNVYRPWFPHMTESEAVRVGRWAMFVTLAVGVLAASMMDSVFSALLLVQTVSVPFGAAVMLMFFWRRLTVTGAWLGLTLAITINVVGPFVLAQIPSLRTSPTLTERVADGAGRPQPVYFESVVRPADRPEAPLEGRGRLHLELVALNAVGLDVPEMTTSGRFAARFFFNAVSPFVLLIGFSLLTRPPRPERIDQFFGRMKTPVGETAEAEAAGLAETRRDPHRFDHLKLFPRSSWEFTKWNRVDTVGFLVCCAISGGIILLFRFLLDVAGGG
ncbi:MAG TPA: hypothetical protein VHF69_14315, partial [Candidatus Synoicihabitans sp.]|nr:hypothetical protein [Candidatus Synoicihabitans sp.]